MALNTEVEPPAPLEQYFEALFQRRLTAKRVPFMAVSFADGSSPEHNQCHLNVDRWIREHGENVAIRGWLVMGNETMHWKFIAHSVVGVASGGAVDITPLRDELPFLAHLGSEEEFARFLVANLNDVVWRPVPPALMTGAAENSSAF